MNTKLTLSLDKEIIQRAKKYAKKNNISLSFLIENYLLKIISDYKGKTLDISRKGSIVDELSGIVTLNKEKDYREDYTDYLMEKYK